MASADASLTPRGLPATSPARSISGKRFVLLLCCFGLISHFLIHAYATRLADDGQLLRFAKPTTGKGAAVAAAAVTPPAAYTAGAARASLSRSRQCGEKLSVLVIHEHHLKPIGSDLRLLGVVRQLRSLDHTVSLLFRGKTPAEQRSPPTAELAALLSATSGDLEFVLSSSALPPRPPAIYEHSDLESLSVLARQGWFDAVFCPLWFWRDPMASAAELLLPTLALHAPPGQRPFLGILSDDVNFVARGSNPLPCASRHTRPSLPPPFATFSPPIQPAPSRLPRLRSLRSRLASRLASPHASLTPRSRLAHASLRRIPQRL